MLKKIIFLLLFLIINLSIKLSAENYWWGNQYLIYDSKSIEDYDSTAVITNNNRRLAFRFTSPIDVTVDSVSVYIGATNNPPYLSFRVETMNSSGQPSGILVDPNAVRSYKPTGTGAKTVNFAGSFTLQKNVTYFLVIQTNGTSSVSGNSYYDFRVSLPLNSFYYYNSQNREVEDTTLNLFSSTNNGVSWKIKNYAPLFMFKNGSDYVLGTPYNGKNTIYLKNGTTKVQEVILTPKKLIVDMLRVYMGNSGTPGILNYSIDEVTNLNNLGIKSNVINGEFGGEPSGWWESGFEEPVTLFSNRVYMISFYCPTATTSDYYKTYGLKGWNSIMTWYSTNAYAAVNSSDFYSTKRADIPFALHIIDTNISSTTGSTQIVTNSSIVYITNITSKNKESDIEEEKFYSPYPNVFARNSDSSINLMFDLKENSEVFIAIYNIKGEKVATLLNSYLDAGHYKIAWGGAIGEFNAHAVDINSSPAVVGMSGNKIKRGIYIVVIKINNKIIRNKLFVK